ncbi:unnamed protein product, partial [Acanthoscelides obtectus]
SVHRIRINLFIRLVVDFINATSRFLKHSQKEIVLSNTHKSNYRDHTVYPEYGKQYYQELHNLINNKMMPKKQPQWSSESLSDAELWYTMEQLTTPCQIWKQSETFGSKIYLD